MTKRAVRPYPYRQKSQPPVPVQLGTFVLKSSITPVPLFYSCTTVLVLPVPLVLLLLVLLLESFFDDEALRPAVPVPPKIAATGTSTVRYFRTEIEHHSGTPVFAGKFKRYPGTCFIRVLVL